MLKLVIKACFKTAGQSTENQFLHKPLKFKKILLHNSAKCILSLTVCHEATLQGLTLHK